jgi:hypothetical protein
MTKKKYRQQSDSSPLSESTSFVPVSHSDDEGNVVIDTTTDAPTYEPIPEVVELELELASPSSYTDPVVSDTLSTLIETVARIPDPVPVPDTVPVPDPTVPVPDPTVPVPDPTVPVPDPTVPVTALAEETLTPVTVPVPDTVPDPVPDTVHPWSRFKSWLSRCCCCLCCCRHRRHRRPSNDTI